MTTHPEDHFHRLTRLLEFEARAEAEQALAGMRRMSAADAERAGDCLAGLVVIEESSGLGGRCLLTLAKKDRSAALPWTRLGAGSPVLLTLEADREAVGLRGVVSERTTQQICIALNEPPDEREGSVTYRADLSVDEIARQRQRAVLDRARTAKKDRLAELREILLGQNTPAFDEESPGDSLDPALNSSQQQAVRFALSARDVGVIHGPPGTGKTRTVVELIRRAIRRGERVLACAPSNLAVDNMLERLLAAGEKAVRLGHPARVLPELREHTLDLMVENHADARLARKFVKEAFSLFRKANKWTRAKPEPGAKRDMRVEARTLLADARRLEAQAIESILDDATVVCATTTGLDGELLGTRGFDLAVIDEAAQGTEPGSWIPLLRCRRVVLAGDHRQLPPTVVSQQAAAGGFGISLMERLMAIHGDAISRLLNVQYRMHESIMRFPSAEFYGNELIADPSVRGHRLCDLPAVRSEALTERPVEFIDTAGAGYHDEVEPDGESRLNPEESRLIVKKVHALIDSGVTSSEIAVITPYAGQVRWLRSQLPLPGLEIDTVDGFQGREKEAVLVSFVRSNLEGEIGFLADVRRTNVALTRARRKLLVVGDSATLAADPFYRRLFEYFEAIGAYGTVWEEG